MFEKPYNLLLYLFILLLLCGGVWFETNLTVVIAIVLFIIWDGGYFLKVTSLKGRTIELALQQIQNIREHISYFLAFYGVLFAILFTQSMEKQIQFLKVSNEINLGLFIIALPFVLAIIPILFVPIQLARSSSEEPSDALKALVVISALFQKVSIFLFVHIVLRILFVLSKQVS
jgi:hypothetical protein